MQDKEDTTVSENLAKRHAISVIGAFSVSWLPACDRILGRVDSRRVLVLAIALFMALAVNVAPASRLRINLSSSMPRGIYRLTDATPRRGALVALCLDHQAAAVALARMYVGAGSCPDGSEPLLKRVVAEEGDIVTTTEGAVVVNGVALTDSATFPMDSSARPLPRYQWGRRRLQPGELWVFSSAARSWDSRYFGPVHVEQVIGTVEPAFTVE